MKPCRKPLSKAGPTLSPHERSPTPRNEKRIMSRTLDETNDETDLAAAEFAGRVRRNQQQLGAAVLGFGLMSRPMC
jgi:hypothetical protein